MISIYNSRFNSVICVVDFHETDFISFYFYSFRHVRQIIPWSLFESIMMSFRFRMFTLKRFLLFSYHAVLSILFSICFEWACQDF